MSSFLEFLKTIDWGKVVTELLSLFILCLILVFKLVASGVKNEKLKKLILILPDALEYAERNGTNPSSKLDLCVEYIQERIKKLSRSIIVDFIESGVAISKSDVNREYSQESLASSESRISIPEKRSKR